MERYTRTAMILHWLLAALVIANLSYTWFIGSFPDAAVRPLIDLHKSFGLSVLGLVLLRLLWRATHRPPPLPAEIPRSERIMAHTAHALLYLLILALPITGWVHDSAFSKAAQHPLTLFWVIPWFRIGAIASLPPARKEAVHAFWFGVHVWLSYVLIGLVVLHLAGVLKHEVLDRTGVLRRMLPGRHPKRGMERELGRNPG